MVAAERREAELFAARDALLDRGAAPRVGIVLGSGLGLLTGRLKNSTVVPYGEIPNMPKPAVEGHAGELHLGTLGSAPVACLSGRAHLYEGHRVDQSVFGVRLLALLGVNLVIVTNAAGGISRARPPGSLLLLADHLNLTGQNPLIGPNLASFGPRFPDLSTAYDVTLRAAAKREAGKLGIQLDEGIYAGLLGPSYETPAEINMLERLGADAVGMSTVLEVIALRHMRVRCVGISCITNLAAGRSSGELSHEEVGETARRVSQQFCDLVEALCNAPECMAI